MTKIDLKKKYKPVKVSLNVWDEKTRDSKLELTQVETENMIFYGDVQSVSSDGTIRFNVDSYEAKEDGVADYAYPKSAPHYMRTDIHTSQFSQEMLKWFVLNRNEETGELDRIMVRVEEGDAEQTYGYVGLQLEFHVGRNQGVIYDKTPKRRIEEDDD